MRPTRHQLNNSPYRLAPIGKEIGKAAAELASKTEVPKDIDYLASTGDEAKFAVSESAKSFRFNDRPEVKLSGNQLPVLGRWDVVVVGGGTSGAPAALASARAGARTLAIEYMDELGGVGTAGMISTYWYGFRNGYTAEVDKGSGYERELESNSEVGVATSANHEKWCRALVCQLWVWHCDQRQ
jgi:NADPH-dependent 2,4-dienoyl-CoA reductase/sulfur reductase-like enzyme